MPTVTYSAQEYAELLAESSLLRQRLEHAEKMRPLWAQGYSSDSVAAQSMAGALHQLWEMLGAENQTQAVGLLRQLKA